MNGKMAGGTVEGKIGWRKRRLREVEAERMEGKQGDIKGCVEARKDEERKRGVGIELRKDDNEAGRAGELEGWMEIKCKGKEVMSLEEMKGQEKMRVEGSERGEEGTWM